MIPIIVLALYLILVLGYILTYFFIIYHLVRYSLRPSLNSIVLPVFIIGSALILLTNIMLFFSVDWKDLLSFIAY